MVIGHCCGKKGEILRVQMNMWEPCAAKMCRKRRWEEAGHSPPHPVLFVSELAKSYGRSNQGLTGSLVRFHFDVCSLKVAASVSVVSKIAWCDRLKGNLKIGIDRYCNFSHKNVNGSIDGCMIQLSTFNNTATMEVDSGTMKLIMKHETKPYWF